MITEASRVHMLMLDSTTLSVAAFLSPYFQLGPRRVKIDCDQFSSVTKLTKGAATNRYLTASTHVNTSSYESQCTDNTTFL